MATKASEGKPTPPQKDGPAARKPRAKRADKALGAPEPVKAPEVVAEPQPETDPKDAEIKALKKELYEALVVVHQGNGPTAVAALNRARELSASE